MHTRKLPAAALALLLVGALAQLALAQGASLAPAPVEEPRPKLAFVGLHGGVFDQLEPLAEALGVEVGYLPDARFERDAPLPRYDLIFLQHLRSETRDGYRRLLAGARRANPRLAVLTLSGYVASDLVNAGVAARDDALAAYYSEGASRENLRRMLVYSLVTYLGRRGEVEPPLQVPRGTVYHPSREDPFPDLAAFLRWARRERPALLSGPRVAVVNHLTHVTLQSKAVMGALVEALEARGALAPIVVDYTPAYVETLRQLRPHVVVHGCHSRDPLDLRVELGAPHLSGLFFKRASIAEWEAGGAGLSASEAAFLLTSQEPLGAIEPQVMCGTRAGGGSGEAFVPIPERIGHLAERALSWARLARLKNEQKKVALIYYDRELGKAELLRGSATGMFLNGPRSMVALLRRLDREGYRVEPLPRGERELLGWLQERGRQIGVWAPETLARLARSGEAALVSLADYERWLRARVPAAQRRRLEEVWGPAPGRLLVWRDERGREQIVIPRVQLGNVLLLPQPLRGEAHDPSKLHDLRVPPPHNYLATYFWLEEEFGAHALIHFGTHGSEFLLPGRGVGLSPRDWPDVVLGALPNLNLWVVNNTGEAMPVRRRAYAVLVDHLTPPLERAGLSDELEDLHGDIDKWRALASGALERTFRRSITRQARQARLLEELALAPAETGLLSAAEVEQVAEYLHDVAVQATPTRLHVLGRAPPAATLVPYVTTCLRARFQRALGSCFAKRPTPTAADGAALDRERAERVVGLAIRDPSLTPRDALRAVGGALTPETAPVVSEGLALARRLARGLAQAESELDGVLEGLAGRFVPPGPANSPDRNPAVLPTGRNMYLLNPEELPTRPSWELGVQLTDRLLREHLARHERYPRRVAFDLSSFSTFRDYGVMESQILYLLGVRPCWNERRQVVDVELIPRAELGRPRIDVFVWAKSYYRDMLPSRLRLLDKAIRLVTGLDEEQNQPAANAREIAAALAAAGAEPAEAAALGRARIFGAPPGQISSGAYYYLAERTGEWDTREELAQTYMRHNRFVYTAGRWGVEARRAYEAHLRESELVLRSWSDQTLSPLSNKYSWWQAGSLSLAIEHLSGREPGLFLNDVRDPDRAGVVAAAAALQRDFRARLFNRRWIEGMMREGYAGADQIAIHVSNALGWEIMRPESVSDATWEEVAAVFVRDRKRLGLRQWFERENPFAYQELTELLLETIRKGYWQASDETKQLLAREYAASVTRHGEGGGLRGGGNHRLQAFVHAALEAAGARASSEALRGVEGARLTAQASAGAEEAGARAQPSTSAPPAGRERVEGRALAPAAAAQQQPASQGSSAPPWLLAIACALALLLLLGYLRGPGGPLGAGAPISSEGGTP